MPKLVLVVQGTSHSAGLIWTGQPGVTASGNQTAMRFTQSGTRLSWYYIYASGSDAWKQAQCNANGQNYYYIGIG